MVTTWYIGPLEIKQQNGQSTQTLYLRGGGGLLSKHQGGTTEFYHQNHLGSTELVTNSSGNVVSRMRYYPFGEVDGPNSTNEASVEKTFTGQQADSGMGGLMYYNGRYYDPTISRFISADPIITDKYNLQSYNRYAYVNNGPTINNDPSGKILNNVVKGVTDLLKNTSDAIIHTIQSNVVGAQSSIAVNTSGLQSSFDNNLNGLKNSLQSNLNGMQSSVYNNITGLSAEMAVVGKRSDQIWKILEGTMSGTPEQVLSKLTWQQSSNSIGLTYSLINAATGGVRDVKTYKGSVVIRNWSMKRGGITLGSIINLNRNASKDLLIHEYGHVIQSRHLGPLYISYVGIPSIISAASDGNDLRFLGLEKSYDHHCSYIEINANHLAQEDLNHSIDRDFKCN